MIPGATGIRDQGRGSPRLMTSMDPPDHGAYRRMVIPDFIPKAVKEMGPRVVALATEIIDGVIEKGECDLVTDVAGLMPSYVIAEMLGLPLADGVALYDLTETIPAPRTPNRLGRARRPWRCCSTRMASGRSGVPARETTCRPSSRTPPSTANRSARSTSGCSSCCSSTPAAARPVTSWHWHAGPARAYGPARPLTRGHRRPPQHRHRGAPALGQPGRVHAADGDRACAAPWQAYAKRRETRSSCTTAPPIAIRARSPRRMRSTSTAGPTSMSRSAGAGRTSASARTWAARDPGHAARDTHPATGSEGRSAARVAPVHLHLRREASARRVQAGCAPR